ncbi:acyl-CoA dehydrogenase family protein, partial [Streptomyces sp.]|uniref:acyl-CoA dehydrogenase family protein n=1 Tax=Streptomyces sp. TaxID=1931 RepID=UPI002F91D06E
MGIAITHEQRELASAVRGLLGRVAPGEEVRKHLDVPGTATVRPGYWEVFAEQGLLGVHLPEVYGGGGGGLVDLAVVLEEAGRAVLPGPYLPSVLAAEVLRRGGLGGLVEELGSGRRIGAVALGAGALTAVPDGNGGLLLTGAAPPVLGGAQADLLVLAAETADGTVFAAVDAEDLAVRVHDGADPTRPTAEVVAASVAVPEDRVLRVDDGLVRDLAALLFAADACGTAGRALETAAGYAKVREQFGRPIGQFQGVKHLCADMLVRLEQARALTWDAALAAGDATADVRSLTAALAASAALDAAYSCAKDCIQILGGIGFTWEHDAHLFLRRAVVARQLLGAGDAHRARAVRLAAAGTR